MITLHNQTFDLARTIDNEPLVIVQRGKMWRVASERDTLLVMAGLKVCPLRIVE